MSDQAPHGDRRARLDEALGLILVVSGQGSFATTAGMAGIEGHNWPELIVLAAREATDPTHGRGVEELTAAIAVVLGVPLDELLTIDQMIEVAAPAAPPPFDPTATPDISGERAAEDIAEVRETRWRATHSERAELGLIAELLGIDVSGAPMGPAFNIGDVLAAARAALSSPTQTISPFFTEEMLERAGESLAEFIAQVSANRRPRHIGWDGLVGGRGVVKVEFDTYERDTAEPPTPRSWLRYWDNLGRSVEELSARREEIIGIFNGPPIHPDFAARLSEERERIEVELERRTRPEPDYMERQGYSLLGSAMSAVEELLDVLSGHGALTASIEDVDIPEEWPSVDCENVGHEQSPEQHGVEDWRCPDCGSIWWATAGEAQSAGYHIEAFLFRLVAELRGTEDVRTQERRITINKAVFNVKGRAMWGLDLYRVPTPPLDPDYFELFQEMPGGDAWISPAQLVDFDQGESFYSTPRRAGK